MDAVKAAESWRQRPVSMESSLISQAVQPVGSPYNKAMRLGYAASERGDYTAATDHFREPLLYVPEDREATIAYWNARKALHAKLSPRNHTPLENAYDRAMRLGYDETHARDYQSALVNFQRALKERPGDNFAIQAVRNVSAYIAAQKGEPLPQIEQAELNVASEGYAGESSYDRYMRLGYAAAKEKNHSLAADYFRSAILDRPDDRMATIAFWNQKHALIQTASGRPATINAATYERMMRLAYDANERQQFDDALSYFEAALKARPGDPYATQAVRNVRTYLQGEVR
jgi:tetratricopeptide (TPR) repeat protein